jgi:tetratricopeptide (TPR) repeat protein
MSVGKIKALAGVTGLVLVASFCHAQSQGPPSHMEPGPPSRNGKTALSPTRQGELPEEAAELFRKASELILKDRPAEAIPLLRRALELAPNQGRIHHYLGYALMLTSQRPAAQKEFETALKLEPGNVYSEYFLALTLDKEGQRDQALALYEAILASGDVIYDTYQRLGQAYARKKEFPKALAMTQQALELTPWDGALRYQLATIYRQLGRTEEAKQEFETAERMKSVEQSSIQKMLELSQAVNLKNWERVSTLRQELMNQSGKDPDLMTWLGAFLGRGGRYTEALEALQKASADGPCAYETCYNLGLTFARLGRKQEAEGPLKQALALRPDSFEVNSILAVNYVEQGRNREAIERLRAAKQARPENLSVLLLLGHQYLEGYYVQQAIDSFREALRLKPDDIDARYLLIEAYEKDEEYDKALEVARETLRLYPQEARAHLEVGHELTFLGHYQEGRPYFEETIQLDPFFVGAHVFLGDLNIRSGDYEAALRSYQRARDLDGTNMDAVRGVGQSRLKRFSQALTELKKSIADYPEDGELYLQLAEVYGRLGNMQEAQQARTTFDKLHAKEVMVKNSQRPRTFSP